MLVLRLIAMMISFCTGAIAVEPTGPTPEANGQPSLPALIRQFGKEKNLSPEFIGLGAFRAVICGDTDRTQLAKNLQLGNAALERLERWSGNQQAFIKPGISEAGAYYLLLMREESTFNSWVDYGRSRSVIEPAGDGQDLVKKLKGFAMPGAMVSTMDRLESIGGQFSVYAASCVALDRIAAANGSKKRLPAWLREGMAAELQRQLTGTIRCTTISYQTNDSPDATSDNWMADVKVILRDRKPGSKAMTAEEVLGAGTDMISGSTYRQMWSLCTFLRIGSDAKAKPKSPTLIWKVIQATASGTESMAAIKEAYGITPAQLNAAWQKWANSASMPPSR